MMVRTLILYCLTTLLSFVKGQNVSTSFNIETSTLQLNSLRLVPVSPTTMRASFTLNSTLPELTSTLFSSVLPSGSTVSAPVSAGLTSDSVSTGPILSVLQSTLAPDTVSMATDLYHSANISQVQTLNSSLISSISVGVMATKTFYPESSSTDSDQNSSKASAILSDIAVHESTSALERSTTVSSLTSTIFVSSVSSAFLPALNDTVHEISVNATSLSYVTETAWSELNTTETSTISNSFVSPTSAVQISNSLSIDLHDSFKDSSDVLSTYPSETSAIFVTSASNPISGTLENYSILGTEETSIRTDHFTESVYSLANISTSSVLLIPSQPSTVASISVSDSNSSFTSSDDSIASILPTLSSEILFSTSELTGPYASVSVNVTEVVTKPLLMQTSTLSYTENTTSNIDHLYTSEYNISPSSQTSEQHLTTSIFPSSSIGTVHITQSSSSNVTQTLESLVHTISATIPPPVTSETYSSVTTSSVTSLSSGQAVTMNTTTSTSKSTTAFTTSTRPSTETTNIVSTHKQAITSTPTTTGNLTLQDTVKEHKVYRVMFTFAGYCEILGENELLQVEFWKAFMYILQSTTKLHLYNLNAEQMLCDPLLRIYLRIGMLNESASVNITQIFESLKCRIASSELFVPIIEGMHVLNYTAMKFEVVEIISSDMNELEVAKTGLELVDVVIISIASFLFAVLVFMMIIVLCRECYVRKRTTTFHLSDVPHVNLKLSDFTLTRIPRPKMFYRENSFRKPGPIPVNKLRSVQNGHSDANGNDRVKVNPDHIRVRMSKHEDGLVVGVTCSNAPSPKNDSSSCSSSPINGDQARASLLKGVKKDNSDGVTNPSYSTDEEQNGNTKIVIEEDENEQLL